MCNCLMLSFVFCSCSKRVKISEEQDVEYDYAPIDIPSQTSRKASGRNGKKTVTKSRQKKQVCELKINQVFT